MLQYAKWSAAARGADPGCARAEDFYTDPWAQNIFRNYLATLTARVNSFTGIPYRCLCAKSIEPCYTGPSFCNYLASLTARVDR